VNWNNKGKTWDHHTLFIEQLWNMTYMFHKFCDFHIYFSIKYSMYDLVLTSVSCHGPIVWLKWLITYHPKNVTPCPLQKCIKCHSHHCMKIVYMCLVMTITFSLWTFKTFKTPQKRIFHSVSSNIRSSLRLVGDRFRRSWLLPAGGNLSHNSCRPLYHLLKIYRIYHGFYIYREALTPSGWIYVFFTRLFTRDSSHETLHTP
jgi:hypothetical protein